MPGVTTFSPSGNSFIDGVIGGEKWSSTSLTYGFPATADAYGSQYGFKETTTGFNALSSNLQQVVRSVLGQYQKIALLTFTETTSPAADMRYARTGATSTAWAYTPQTAQEGGDVWLNNSLKQFDSPQLGGYAYLITLHETGHTMGFKEAYEVDGAFGALPASHDSLEYTVMSYASYVGANIKNGYANGFWDYPQTLMLDDVRALQFLYGANFNNVGKSITYSWNPNSGEMSIDGVGQGVPGANKIFMTVWTGGAKATYDFSAYAEGVNIDLRPGEWSTASSSQLANLGAGHTAAGNIANAYYVSQDGHDDLVANVIGGSGNDTLLGNDADNRLTGGKGDDRIDGGAGTDTAVYAGRSNSYSMVHDAAGSYTITALGDAKAEGKDVLWNVEYVEFADGKISVEDFARTSDAARKAAQVEVAPQVTATVTPDHADIVIAADTHAADTAAPAVVDTPVVTPPAVTTYPPGAILIDTATAVAQVGGMAHLLELAQTYGWTLI